MAAVSPHPETEVEINGSIKEHLRAGAFFFMRKPESRSLTELAGEAGVVDQHFHRLADEAGAEIVHGDWAGFITKSRLREYDEHICLEIYFSVRAFDELYGYKEPQPDLPLDHDPAEHIAYSFRDACLRLRPDVGLFTTSSIWAQTEYMGTSIYPWVKDGEAYDLAFHASLLYVNDMMKYNLLARPRIDEREDLPVPEGRLVFGGRGGHRWDS